jgi:hypothetical protein
VSKSSRDKGRRGELEALELLNDHGIEGDLDYGQSAHGGCDISTDLGGFEVKRRAYQFALLYQALEQDGCVGVLHRDDRHGWLLTVPAALGLTALKANRKD